MVRQDELVEQRSVLSRGVVVRPAVPFLARFVGKFVLDIMPAALASVIGGILFTQYQFGHVPPRPATEAVTPASAEMMALVRDEHAMIMDYLKAQAAAERSRTTAAALAEAHPATEALAAEKASEVRIALENPGRRLAAVVTTRPLQQHVKLASAAIGAPAPHAPLDIVQPQQAAVSATAGSGPAPRSLLTKTLDIKDHMVAATRRVVFMIGDAFAAVGERIGSAATAKQFSSES